jgi:hypothetical protein
MSLIILHGSRLPVVRIARIAGQYAKPRSKPTEMVDMEVTETGPNGDQITKTEKKEILSFRGDNVNGYDATDRQPDPDRLLGYVLSYADRGMELTDQCLFPLDSYPQLHPYITRIWFRRPTQTLRLVLLKRPISRTTTSFRRRH